jgi:Fe-S-cluster containining protein
MKCNPNNDYRPPYFFDAGIRFQCRRCGACCTGDPGIIRISNPEILMLADFLKMTASDLTRIHLRPITSGFSIAEEADGRCRFYDQGCRIYPVRPLQCRTYPFWFNLMRASRQWEKAMKECPGIGNGTLYPRERILDIVSKTMDYLEFT